MAVYNPTYTDKKTGKTIQQKIWWYHFTFAGRHVQESSKSTRKTIATEAEKKRRLELEKGFNQIEDNRQNRIRTVARSLERVSDWLHAAQSGSATFAEYATGHLKRLLGSVMVVDVSDETIKSYQTARLTEKAAAKSINEETGLLLRMMEFVLPFGVLVTIGALIVGRIGSAKPAEHEHINYTPAEDLRLGTAPKHLLSGWGGRRVFSVTFTFIRHSTIGCSVCWQFGQRILRVCSQ